MPKKTQKNKASVRSMPVEVESSVADAAVDLKKENESLKAQLSSLTSIKAELDELMRENKELRERSKKAENKERYVGVRSTIDGDIWLPSPSAGSGLKEDGNSGILLKGHKAVIIPAHWAVGYIVNQSPTFLSGNAVFDNDAGKKINPGVSFSDLDLPDEFKAASIVVKDLENLFRSGSSDDVIEYIDTKCDNKFSFYKVYSYAKSLDGKYKGKMKIFIEQVITYLESHDMMAEKKEKK